jgi:hypothetical protein
MTNLATETTTSKNRPSYNEQTSQWTTDDRRVFPRYPMANKLAVQLRVLPATGVIPAQVHDLSRDGIGLLTRVFIAPGESITFPVGTDWVVADVRHCRPYQEGYLVGGVITDIVYETEPAN